MKLRTNDEILVLRGKDKGQKGKIEKLLISQGKVLITGINVYKKHQKGMPGKPGGIIELSRPLPASSVALVCPNCSKPTRIGMMILKDSVKARVCKKCGRQIGAKKE